MPPHLGFRFREGSFGAVCRGGRKAGGIQSAGDDQLIASLFQRAGSEIAVARGTRGLQQQPAPQQDLVDALHAVSILASVRERVSNTHSLNRGKSIALVSRGPPPD
jgi:hypothetical protein